MTCDEDAVDICALDACVNAGQFSRAIKYLGIFLGHDALKINWEMVSPDFLSTARFIGSLDCGLLTKISLYNMLAISKLSYVAAFLPPNREILKIESRAIQLLLRGPWNAVPADALKHVKIIGLPTQIRDLAVMSQASRIRVASSTSKNVIEVYDRCIDLFNNSNELVLRHLDRHFLFDSCLHHIVFQFRRFVQEFGDLGDDGISQSVAYKKLLERAIPFDFGLLFCKTLSRHFENESLNNHVPQIFACYRKSISKIGFAPLMTHLRAVTNHWCTSSRFGVKKRPCLFGCGFESDRISHTVCCPLFWDIFCGLCGFANHDIDLTTILLLRSEGISGIHDHCNFLLLGIHICFLCYNACRYGLTISRRIVLHKLFGYTRSHHCAAVFVRRLRHHRD